MTSAKRLFSLKIKLLNPVYAASVIVLIIICFPANKGAFPHLTPVLRIATFPCAAWAVCVLIKGRVIRNKWLIPMWCMFALMVLCNIVVNWGSLLSCVITVLRMFTVTVLADYMMSKDKLLSLRWFACIWGVLMIMEFLSMVTHIFPSFISSNNVLSRNYLFGIRVEINEYLIYTIAFLGFAYYSNQIGRILPVLAIFCGVYFVIAEKVSTSITGLLVFIAVFVATKVVKSTRAWAVMIFLLVVFIVLFIVDRNTKAFEPFITGVLDKDITLSGRTVLWEQALSLMKGIHLIFGYGYVPPFLLHLNVAAFNHPHNQYLQMLFDFGIPGFITYMVIIINQIRQIRRIKKNKQIKSIYIASIIATLIICMSSRNFFYLTAQIYYVIANYLPEIDEYKPGRSIKLKIRR